MTDTIYSILFIVLLSLIGAYSFGRLFAKGILHEFNSFFIKTFKQYSHTKKEEDGTKEEK